MFSYMAMGDSITVGRGASSPDRSYPHQTAAMRRQRVPVRGLIVARSGWTSGQLSTAVRRIPPELLRQINTVSILIGGNDIRKWALPLLQGAPISTLQPALSAFEHNLNHCVSYLLVTSGAKLLLCGLYNPFPNSPVAVKAIGELNERIARISSRHSLQLISLDSVFAGEEHRLIAGYRTGRLEDIVQKPLFAPNPIHPNDKGHARIAQSLLPYMVQNE